jgi:hypothetical protein
MLMSWPDGIGTQMRIQGRCRDLLTPVSGDAEVLAEAQLAVGVALDRTIEEISATPAQPALAGLVGARGGGSLRSALDEVVPDQRQAGTPLSLLLDDIAGATLIAGFAWLRWRDQLPEVTDGLQAMAARLRNMPRPSMEGICSGFRPGASSLNPDGTQSGLAHNVVAVPPLADVNDPLSWHPLETAPPVAMRRARRNDVHPDVDGQISVDAMFRDSSWEPDGTEIAVHEYHLLATVDGATGTLTSVVAEPRVLPFAECPMAGPKAARLSGLAVGDLRTEVLQRLRGTDCCTHLNDALRALAEVPVLALPLEARPT